MQFTYDEGRQARRRSSSVTCELGVRHTVCARTGYGGNVGGEREVFEGEIRFGVVKRGPDSVTWGLSRRKRERGLSERIVVGLTRTFLNLV